MKAGIANLTVSPTLIAAISKSNVSAELAPNRHLAMSAIDPLLMLWTAPLPFGAIR